ncbi:MAG: serine protein kinase, partial [Gammaproteobacteria bacterium]
MTTDPRGQFLESLTAFTQEHRAKHWEGDFREFLQDVIPQQPERFTRNSHQYVWSMLRRTGIKERENGNDARPYGLFTDELFGITDALERIADYFKAASAGSEVGRRLLLLLGPPSGGKSTMVILLKRGLEEYSHTDAGALYAIKGCPVDQSPLHLIPHTLRGNFRETYGVEIAGEL